MDDQSNSSRKPVSEVLSAHTEEWMKLRGVIGAGETKKDDRPAIMAAIQWSRHPGATPLGLLISDPEHFARKWSTHLFHPEYGLSKTMLTVILDGVRYRPDESTQVVWYPDELPGITAMWRAGEHYVIERFWTAVDEPIIAREITINGELQVGDARLEISLYGNPALFSQFLGNEYGLSAQGYDAIIVSSHVAVGG